MILSFMRFHSNIFNAWVFRTALCLGLVSIVWHGSYANGVRECARIHHLLATNTSDQDLSPQEMDSDPFFDSGIFEQFKREYLIGVNNEITGAFHQAFRALEGSAVSNWSEVQFQAILENLIATVRQVSSRTQLDLLGLQQERGPSSNLEIEGQLASEVRLLWGILRGHFHRSNQKHERSESNEEQQRFNSETQSVNELEELERTRTRAEIFLEADHAEEIEHILLSPIEEEQKLNFRALDLISRQPALEAQIGALENFSWRHREYIWTADFGPTDELAEHPFLTQGTWKPLLRVLAQWGTLGALTDLSSFAAERLRAVDLGDALQKIVERGDEDVHGNLVEKVLPYLNGRHPRPHLRAIITQGSDKILASIAKNIFSNPQTPPTQEDLKSLIAKGDQKTQEALVRLVFSQPHTVKMKAALRTLIKKSYWSALEDMPDYVFSQPHTRDHEDLALLLIERTNPLVWEYLIKSSLSQPHTINWIRVVRQLLQKTDVEANDLRALKTKGAFMTGSSPAHEILKKAVTISDFVKRVKFMRSEFDKIEQAELR